MIRNPSVLHSNLLVFTRKASDNMKENGIFAPGIQLVVRLFMAVCYLYYYHGVPDDSRVFPSGLTISMDLIYSVFHLFLFLMAAKKDTWIPDMARYAYWMDIGMAHLAWLSDPVRPSAILVFIFISVIFNGMQRGLDIYRHNSGLSICCTIIILISRSWVFGTSRAEFFLTGLLLVMMAYAYVLIERIEALKTRERQKETELRSAHAALEAHRNRLEETVQSRTSDLLKTNMSLMKEIRVRKQAEREARQKQAQLLQAAKMASLGSLVAGLAHEMGNPIALIQANLSILKKFTLASFQILDPHFEVNSEALICNMRYPDIRDRLNKVFDGLDDGAKRVTRLIGDLRTYARQQPVFFSDYFSIEEAVSKAFGLTRSLIEKSTGNFSIEMEEEIPKLRGDLLKIEQVIINLITNACQALTSHDQSIRIRVGTDNQRKRVFVTVFDQGRGMTVPVMERIKDPFFTTRRHRDGTGLGLSISDSIITDHGGELEFESELGKGTIATIFLPLIT